MVQCESIRFNIETSTIKNPNYRKVVFTGEHLQVVLMSLRPREEIGMEVHLDTDQFIRVEKGKATAKISLKQFSVETKTPLASLEYQTFGLTDGVVIIVPAGHYHNIINRSADEPLKLYTIYAPPHHEPCKVERIKQE
jgi:mannose-6-phosphate isomerase-like protein (cupin superfamily)